VSKKTLVSRSNRGCALEKLQIRRNWRVFSVGEKKIYIKAVICLQALPSRTPSYLAPGAKTRYDDFVATHINQTLFIHRMVALSSPFWYGLADMPQGTFLGWHRYFIHEFEQALRDDCGYAGDYP
jgi:tyrosinase